MLGLFNHIEKNRLVDPADDRFILCDEAMKGIFKTDQISVSEMCRRIDEHFQ